jgi:integral membrane sensor domain MASE1
LTNFANIWVTWWLGDAAGALVFAPVIVLWALATYYAFNRNEFLETVAVLATAAAVGIIAFRPLIAQTTSRDPLGFLAILPLLWAALRCGPRDTATVALILASITIWGTLMGGGPFTSANLNASFLLIDVFDQYYGSKLVTER